MTETVRGASQRKADTVARLESDADVWVATASAGSYASRTGWDPRDEDVPHVFLIATPASMQAWNSPAEIDDRTIMGNGKWTAV
jgi:hypothetical protein